MENNLECHVYFDKMIFKNVQNIYLSSASVFLLLIKLTYLNGSSKNSIWIFENP